MKNWLSALSFLGIGRRCIGLLLLFVVAGGAAAQKDSVLFFNEVDTVFQKVRVGREVDVTYYSTSEIRNLSLPRWDSCGAEQLSPPHNTGSSRTSVVNGKMKSLRLRGISYKVRFHRPGWVTLPVATAFIDGEKRTCTPMKLYVLPNATEIEGISCSFSTDPVTITPDKIFKLVLTCTHRPDESKPELEHPGIEMLTSSFSFSRQNGREEYKFTYVMKIVQPGSHFIKIKRLTFGGVNYPLEPYLLKVRGETYL